MRRKGETYVVFRERVKRRLRVLTCTVWKHRRHLVDHGLRIEVAEERLDRHEKDVQDLRLANKALARIEERRLKEELQRGRERAEKPPRRRG